MQVHRVLHLDRKSTRLNSSHLVISYAVFCLKKHIDLLFVNDTANTEIYTLSLHDALPISIRPQRPPGATASGHYAGPSCTAPRSEEHTSELQSPCNLVCCLLLEKAYRFTFC